MKTRTRLLLFLALLASLTASASHNSAGNITFEQVGDLTVRATIHTFTVTSAVAADRDTLTICWGDGNCEAIARTAETLLSNDRKHNEYTWEHTYPAQGSYTIWMSDPNRGFGIINIPNSGNVPFHLQTSLTLGPLPNSGPVLLEHPFHLAYVGETFVHIPNAFDAEGDSIAYQIWTPYQGLDLPVGGYIFPHNVGSSQGAIFMLNETTGTLIWDAPLFQGEYVIAILINEFRNGQLIGSTLRDMVIEVHGEMLTNAPPEILLANDEIEVLPGETIDLDLTFNDPDGDITLAATGGPLLVGDPAVFDAPQGLQEPPVTVNFQWETTTAHGRTQPYYVVFSAMDASAETKIALKLLKINVAPTTSSVRPTDLAIGWDISPNPTEGMLRVRFDGPAPATGHLVVCGLQGQTLLRQPLGGSAAPSLDLSGLPLGAYFVFLENENGRGEAKRVVVR